MNLQIVFGEQKTRWTEHAQSKRYHSSARVRHVVRSRIGAHGLDPSRSGLVGYVVIAFQLDLMCIDDQVS